MANWSNQPVSGANAGGAVGEGTIFPSASRAAATYTSQEFVNPGAKGIRIFTSNDNANSSTATVKIQVRMPGTSTWTDLAGATTAALGAVSGSILTVYPGLTGIADSAGIAINQHLGPSWRLVLTIGTGTGVSQVSADYLL